MAKLATRTFKEWHTGLAELSAMDLTPREDFAFCGRNLPPEELQGEYKVFCEGWNARFGLKSTPEEIMAITETGWYGITAGAALAVLAESNQEGGFILEREVRRIAEDWASVPMVEPNRAEDAKVIARVIADGWREPYIHEVAFPTMGCTWQVEHGLWGSWSLTETWPRGECFSIEIPGPGTIPFERACRRMKWQPGSPWGLDAALATLEWIFAAGEDNALKAADDVLSDRKGETAASARKKVRAALA